MFGERLADLRKGKKLSQYELANRLNLSRGQIANYEQGQRQPDYETLQKLADFFDVTIDYLIGRSDKKRQDNPNPPENELDSRGLSEEAYIFFKDFESLDEEGKQDAIKHIRYLKHLAERKNKEEDN